MRTATLLLVLSASWPVCAGAQRSASAVTARACATDEDLVLGGVNLQDRRASVLQKLGVPNTVTKGKSEDDGGEYDTLTYEYKRLTIVFGRNSIERIATRDPRVKAPRGITIGMTREQVEKRLGPAAGFTYGPLEVGLAACRPPELAELRLVFASRAAGTVATPKLVEVAITNYGP